MNTLLCNRPSRQIFVCFGLFVLYRYACASVEDQQLKYTSTYFQSACLSDLSEKTFKTYFDGVGAIKVPISGQPFSTAYGLPGYIAATHYRQPIKCCLSMRDVGFDKAVRLLSVNLALQNPKSLMFGDRKGVVFLPKSSNRIVTMDFSKSSKTSITITNICHVSHPDAKSFYRALPN
jgi:hypothetical protein